MDKTFLEARGTSISLRYGDDLVKLTAGQNKLAQVSDHWAVASGRVVLADGTPCWAVLGLDPSSSGEHSATGIFFPDGSLEWRGDPGFMARMKKQGKAKEDIFPYRYSYGPARLSRDHHIGDSGWSGGDDTPIEEDVWGTEPPVPCTPRDITPNDLFEQARNEAKLAHGTWYVACGPFRVWNVLDARDNLVATAPSRRLAELIASLPEMCAPHYPSEPTSFVCEHEDEPVHVPTLGQADALNMHPADAYAAGYKRGYIEGADAGFVEGWYAEIVVNEYADARAAQDRANRAEEALREIVGIGQHWAAIPVPSIKEAIERHGVNLGGDQ